MEQIGSQAEPDESAHQTERPEAPARRARPAEPPVLSAGRAAELFDVGADLVPDLLQAFDTHTWSPELDQRFRQAVDRVGDALRVMDLSAPADQAVAYGIRGCPEAPELATQIAELRAELKALDDRQQRLETLAQVPPLPSNADDAPTKHDPVPNDRLKAERAVIVRGRHRWGLRVARFVIGVAIGSAVAGPLVALVPWPAMVGEIVKGAIGGATGVLTSEISDPASDWAEQKLRDLEVRRSRGQSEASSGPGATGLHRSPGQ